MIASLPMYDRPETAAAHDALWAGVRDALRAAGGQAPDALDRAADIEATWENPALILGQTCGMPYRTRLHGRVALVATPDYGLPDTAPGHYRSVFVARADDPRDDPAAFVSDRFAYNSGGSHSGWAAPQLWAKARGFAFRPALATGGHRASAQAVADGRADIAALDAVTWRGIRRFDADLAARLRVLGTTDATPGLPMIAAPGVDTARLRAALDTALAALAEDHRDILGIRGFVPIPPEDYLAVPNPPPPDQIASIG